MKFYIKPFLIFLVALDLVVMDSVSSAETISFHFLRMQVGARPSAMAGAFVAVSGDIHSIYFNPAGLANVNKKVASATYLKHVLDFQSGFLGYAHYLKGIGTVGVGINYINYGTFDETDETGEKLGTFSANSYVVTASFGSSLLPGVFGGTSFKYLRSVIERYSSAAFAVDMGIIYHVPFMQDLNVGFAILNLGKSISAFIDTKEDLPLKFVGGFSKKLAHLPLLFNANVYKFVDDDYQFAIGGEFTLVEGLFLRLGYDSIGRDQHVNSDYDRIAGTSLGLGFNWNQYHFDYSFSSLGQVGSLNRITFSSSF